MPVIEYCAFLAALCLNCGATGPAALKVTAQQGCHGECWEPAALWEEHFLLPQVCFECEPAGFGRSAALCLEGEPGLARSHARLTPLLCSPEDGYLSQHEHFPSSRHSWLQDSFGT